MGIILLLVYSAVTVFLFLALPVVLFVPGLVLQLLVLVPYWAFSITKLCSNRANSLAILFFVLSPLHPPLRSFPWFSSNPLLKSKSFPCVRR